MTSLHSLSIGASAGGNTAMSPAIEVKLSVLGVAIFVF